MQDGRTKKMEDSPEQSGNAFFDSHRVTLVIASGPQAGSEYALDRSPVSVGRGPEADIPIDDSAMSCEHAAFELVDEGFRVRDLASTNGVRVNGGEVLSADLKHGDRVTLGEHEFRFLQETVQPRAPTFVLADDA